MTAPAQPSASQPQRLRVAHLDPRGPTDFALRPAAEARAAIAAELNILALPRLAFEGRIRAEGGQAWALSGRLTAQVVQSCVVTLKPVKTRIEEDVRRLYSPQLRDPEGDEVEMPDETLEPLGQFIDYYKGEWVGVTATGSIVRSEWGLGFGAPITSDEVELFISAELKKN